MRRKGFRTRDAAVQREVAARFVALELDVSEQTEEQALLLRRYGVTDLPTLLLMHAGAAVPVAESGRITGFVPPDNLLRKLREVR